MKHSKFILGLVAGVGIMLLVSFQDDTSENQVPKYHMIPTPADLRGFVLYNGVTGEYKIVSYSNIERNDNITDFISK